MEESHIEYVTGDYVGHDFMPLNKQRLDYGVLYAPLTIADMRGRRMMWGWLRETRSPQAQKEAGWSGVQSLPRVLSLRDDDTLRMQPAPELHALRGVHLHAKTPAEARLILAEIRGQAYEFRLKVSYSGDTVFCVHSGDDALCLRYDARKQTLSLGTHTVDVQQDDSALDVCLYVDGSVIEVLVNERFSISARFYGTELFSYSLESNADSFSLDVWQMQSIW
jgi:beta-fructofuranosidase